MTNSPTDGDSPRTGSLLVIFLTIFVDLLGFGMVIPLLPIYADQFTLDESGFTLGMLMASFSAMQFLVSPLWGRLSDRIGRRPVLLVGLCGSVVFYTLFGVATVMKSLTLLFISRIGAGIAGATIATAQAYIADSTTLEKRPKGMALIGMAFGMGFTFGPLFGFLAVLSEGAEPGPWPGYAAALLSGVALLLAIFALPESLRHGAHPSREHRSLGRAWKSAIATPSIGLVLIAIFICVFSFAQFETTLSLLIKGNERLSTSLFDFSFGQVCLTYAYIGFVLSVVQGGMVRRLAGRFDEGTLGATGALFQLAGFGLTVVAVQQVATGLLFVALTAIVTGFAFMQPNLQSLLSRRSAPSVQGLILGLGQSVSSMARIAGAGLGIPLLRLGNTVPYFSAAVLMCLGLMFILIAARSGRDYTQVTVDS